jgi:hypothetical protein
VPAQATLLQQLQYVAAAAAGSLGVTQDALITAIADAAASATPMASTAHPPSARPVPGVNTQPAQQLQGTAALRFWHTCR